jgi:hypothetical protein
MGEDDRLAHEVSVLPAVAYLILVRCRSRDGKTTMVGDKRIMPTTPNTKSPTACRSSAAAHVPVDR